MAPENDEAAMWLATEATATAGAMPTKINSGVIKNPPPMPNMPETKPTAAPIARMRKTLTGMSAIGRYSCTRGLRSLAARLAETAHGTVFESGFDALPRPCITEIAGRSEELTSELQ